MQANPIRVTLDIVDRCNLRCPSCFRGGEGKGTSNVLDLIVAKNVLEHLNSHFKVSTLVAYNWGEPLLCKNLNEYVDLFATFPQMSLNL